MKGRKPQPASTIDVKESKVNNEFVKNRVDAENRLKTTSHLSCPKDLSEVAQKEWRRLMNLYRKMDAKILNDLDISTLSMYCEAYAIWKENQQEYYRLKKLKEEGGTIENMKVFDIIRIRMNEQTKVISSLAEQLCLSPVGRARFGIGIANKSKEEQELEELKNLMND